MLELLILFAQFWGALFVVGLAGAREVAIKEDGCYEVRRLAHSIASMVSTMRHLMDDIILQEKRKRRSERMVAEGWRRSTPNTCSFWRR